MKRLKITAAAALALAIMLSGQAAAQTVPTLAVSAGAGNGVGATVTIEWSALPLAQGYTLEAGSAPGVANIATVNLPASITRIIVFAPNGTYYLRVRGFAGAIAGDFTPVQTVTVGGPPVCPPLAAPTVTAENSSYLSVKTTWTPADGAVGYMVEYGRFDGVTELAEPVGPTVNTVNKYAGFTGNFFVRVVAHNACGEAAASAYVPFEITSSPGTSPRAPDPPPGQLLPIPSYAQGVVFEMARVYAGPLSRACKNNHEFLFLLLRELRRYDSRWGLNWKRGDVGQGMSSDIVSYNPTHLPDEGNGQVYIFDVIGAECEGNYPSFGNATPVTWSARGNPACGAGTWCTKWTLQPYINAGFVPDGRNEQ